VAALGAATLGIGLALQGPISNYGAGVAIILARTFKVGDTVTISDWFGVVKEIRLAYTLLETEDGEIITIPNKHVIGEIIQNSFEHRVVETIIGIDYADSPELAIDTIRGALESMECVTQDPAFQVGIEGFGDFSINIGLRYWVPTHAYYESKYQVNQKVFAALKDASITIPFPRRDIVMLSAEK
jgi:small conductance mechanosensitive channel